MEALRNDAKEKGRSTLGDDKQNGVETTRRTTRVGLRPAETYRKRRWNPPAAANGTGSAGALPQCNSARLIMQQHSQTNGDVGIPDT
ncbi:hypothetical protein PG993_006682 [Apiospora rasikravindrae]|uniref:Transposase n=1 Tax=Apiospora rasikravindrae TaxID=990691 RepID=A0ABR1T6E5_9PEZI